MKQVVVAVNNPTGLHARPAAVFVEKANQFESQIRVKKDNKIVDGKSILSVLTLGVEQGQEIEIEVEGKDEEFAFQSLVKVIEDGLGEI